MPQKIDVCICTFRRPHIRETLLSLAGMVLPPDLTCQVIVADNDDTPSAQAIVMETAAETGLTVKYVHAPARNISIARNACLDAAQSPLVAFIDDDELAAPGWLAQLAAAKTETIDAVLGPVTAVYADDCPAWIVKSDLHSTKPVWVDGEILTGYTCNVLFCRTAKPFDGLRFKPELGRSGGEDTAFFAAAHNRGARIAYAPDAIVTEAVPAQRATFRWLLKRRFRAGQTHGFLLHAKQGGIGARTGNIAKASCKALACLALALLPANRVGHMRQCLLRGALHAGVVARLLGKADIEQYG